MMVLAPGLTYVDLNFLGRPKAIATGVLSGGGEVALIDPGPTSCLEALEEGLHAQGIALRDVTHVLLTHIHLDHAGATGTIVNRHPRVKVLVHERGAPHVIDPQKLIQSATRLYGAEMDRLWGEILAVPAGSLEVLGEENRATIAGRTLEIAYTPGHATHHVSYFDPSSGVAFVGDTGGMCIDGGYILPPTPPPDVDLEAWEKSARRIEAFHARTLFLTHFGPSPFPPATHLQTFLHNLQTTSKIARDTLAEDGSDDERMKNFGERLEREIRRASPNTPMPTYTISAPIGLQWLGLARYWRKRAERG